jgi:3-hydroxyacyl-CoA dehydrogenase
MDYFPVNALSEGLQNGLRTIVRQLEGTDPHVQYGKKVVTGIVLKGAGRAFCAGANIDAFGGANKLEPVTLGRLFSDAFGFGLEDNTLNIPVVAAIHGFALGGGLETALGVHYRVITADAKIGLPEIELGLLPGGQGTQRLPRLIGAAKALDFMLEGNHVSGKAATELGICDLCVPSERELEAAAIDFCRSKRGLEKQPSIAEMPPPTAIDFGKYRKEMAQKRPGEIAPEAIIQTVEAACKGPWEYGRKVESKLFGPLVMSKESAAMRHMFSAERAGKKISDLPAGVKAKKIKTVGIIGAGLMGGGIGMSCANVGMKVIILDVDAKNLERGMKLVTDNYKRSRSMTDAQKQAAIANFKPSTDYADLKDCDLVVEAAFESMPIKLTIFKKLDEVCKPDAFLCTNTSALDIDEIASAVAPSRRPFVMGTHFFSPANVMKLLENVRGKDTSDLTIATMMEWGTEIGKWCVLAGNCTGFIGNRMLGFYSAGAAGAIAKGALPEQVDAAAKQFGMRMGPMAMADLVGLDLGVQMLKNEGKFDPKTDPKCALIEAGRLGQKTKAGWFDYEDGRTAKPSEWATNMLRQMYPVKAAAPTEEEITRALFMPMINDGFKVLEEGMAQRPSDIDVCYVYGYNFPKVKGGPMHYADAIGLDTVKETLVSMGIKPAQLLEDCIAAKQPLAKYWAKNGGKQWAAAKGKVHPSRTRKAKM